MKKKGFLFNIFFSLSLMEAESIVVRNPHGNALISDQKFWSTSKRQTIKFGRITGKIYWYANSKRTNERETSRKMGPSMKTIKLDIWLKKREETKRNTFVQNSIIYCETLWWILLCSSTLATLIDFMLLRLQHSKFDKFTFELWTLFLFSFSLFFSPLFHVFFFPRMFYPPYTNTYNIYIRSFRKKHPM